MGLLFSAHHSLPAISWMCPPPILFFPTFVFLILHTYQLCGYRNDVCLKITPHKKWRAVMSVYLLTSLRLCFLSHLCLFTWESFSVALKFEKLSFVKIETRLCPYVCRCMQWSQSILSCLAFILSLILFFLFPHLTNCWTPSSWENGDMLV